jgi:hypothetical protein
VSRRQGLVERQTNGLDRDVGRARLLQERSKNARRHISTSTNGDHQLRLELFEDSWSSFLTQFVDLARGCQHLLAEKKLSVASRTYLVIGHILLDDHLEYSAVATSVKIGGS